MDDPAVGREDGGRVATKRPFILVTLDSCRWDAFRQAKTPFFDALGVAVPGRSHGDNTLAGHKALLYGSFPDCHLWPGKKNMIGSSLFLGKHFAAMEYATLGAIALPYLHRAFGFGQGFLEWQQYMPEEAEKLPIKLCPLRYNLDFLTQKMEEHEGPHMIFLNVGETHFPYRHEGEEPQMWERYIVEMERGFSMGDQAIAPAHFHAMYEAQVRQVEWVDRTLMEWAFRDSCFGEPFRPELENAVWFITADHGELFGEHSLYGHGHGSYPEEITVPVLCSDWRWLEGLSRG